MDKELIDDLKQFITATISQQLSDVATKDDLARIERKLDEVQSNIAEALDTSNNAIGAQLQDHDQRLGRIEQAAA